MNREQLLAQLFENFPSLGRQAEELISSLAYELTTADLQDWAVRNEYIPDPDADEDGNYSDDEEYTNESEVARACSRRGYEEDETEETPAELEFEAGDWVEYFDGHNWRAAEVGQVDRHDTTFPYRVNIDGLYPIWARADEVRREQNGAE